MVTNPYIHLVAPVPPPKPGKSALGMRLDDDGDVFFFFFLFFLFSIRFIRQIQFILKEVLKIRLLFLKSSVHFVFAFLFKLVNPNEAWRGANAHLTNVIHDVLVQ